MFSPATTSSPANSSFTMFPAPPAYAASSTFPIPTLSSRSSLTPTTGKTTWSGKRFIPESGRDLAGLSVVSPPPSSLALSLARSLPLAASSPQLSLRPVALTSPASYDFHFQTPFPPVGGCLNVLRTLRPTNFPQAARLHALRRSSHVPVLPTGQSRNPFSRRLVQFAGRLAPFAASRLRPPCRALFPGLALAFREGRNVRLGSYRHRPACLGLFRAPQDPSKN